LLALRPVEGPSEENLSGPQEFPSKRCVSPPKDVRVKSVILLVVVVCAFDPWVKVSDLLTALSALFFILAKDAAPDIGERTIDAVEGIIEKV
jgi:hypothetical protein